MKKPKVQVRISSAWRNKTLCCEPPWRVRAGLSSFATNSKTELSHIAGSNPAALGNPLHILTHARAHMIEQIMAVDERTPARRRKLMAMSDEELNAEYREVVE
jgi:hypothetical protein